MKLKKIEYLCGWLKCAWNSSIASVIICQYEFMFTPWHSPLNAHQWHCCWCHFDLCSVVMHVVLTVASACSVRPIQSIPW